MRLKESDLKKLQQQGKIRGYVTTSAGTAPAMHHGKKSKVSKEKEWMNTQLWAWGREKGLQLVEEHKFHSTRKWRFDWAYPEKKIAIEYEGLFSDKSRHTTVAGFSGDTEKYNEAQTLGWTVLRFTALTYKSLIKKLDNVYQSIL